MQHKVLIDFILKESLHSLLYGLLQATAQMEEKLKTFIDNNATLDLAQESDAVLCFLHYQVITSLHTQAGTCFVDRKRIRTIETDKKNDEMRNKQRLFQ